MRIAVTPSVPGTQRQRDWTAGYSENPGQGLPQATVPQCVVWMWMWMRVPKSRKQSVVDLCK